MYDDSNTDGCKLDMEFGNLITITIIIIIVLIIVNGWKYNMSLANVKKYDFDYHFNQLNDYIECK